MTPYDFEVLKDGVMIDMQSIHLPELAVVLGTASRRIAKAVLLAR